MLIFEIDCINTFQKSGAGTFFTLCQRTKTQTCRGFLVI